MNKFRKFLYTTAKVLGDVQALSSKRKGSIKRRIYRRVLGRVFGKMVRAIVK